MRKDFSLEIEDVTLTQLELLKPEVTALLNRLGIPAHWSVWENSTDSDDTTFQSPRHDLES